MWTPQWPLINVKLKALANLVEEQFNLRHIETSFSEWNFPVDVVLCPSHARFPHAYIIHYMNDNLLASSNDRVFQRLQENVMTCLPEAGLQVATKKIQKRPPYEYLGYIELITVCP